MGFLYDVETARIMRDDYTEPNNLFSLSNPLVINWPIIGTCLNKCMYCYGVDVKFIGCLHGKEEIDPVVLHLRKIAPLVIVISGGEPFLHPNLRYIVTKIKEFSHVIIDTNGLLINRDDLYWLKSANAHIRISLDSHIEAINGSIRKSPFSNSTDRVLAVLRLSLEFGVPCTVQTVLTNKNLPFLMGFYDYLCNLRISNWRWLDVVGKPELGEDNMKKFSYLKSVLEKNAFQENPIKIFYKNEEAVISNNIILVDPKGTFYFRPAGSIGKEVIDASAPRSPALPMIMKRLDINSHINRYVN